MIESQEIATLQEIILIAQKAKSDANESAAVALRMIEAAAIKLVVEYFSSRILG
jgi:hypothetical protein